VWPAPAIIGAQDSDINLLEPVFPKLFWISCLFAGASLTLGFAGHHKFHDHLLQGGKGPAICRYFKERQNGKADRQEATVKTRVRAFGGPGRRAPLPPRDPHH
jgi:hypothetical protein